MRRALVFGIAVLLTAAVLRGGTIGVERMDTFDSGIRLANGQWKIGSGTKMKYYDFWGDVASTQWHGRHWINDLATGDSIAGGDAGTFTTDVWTSTVEGIAEFSSCNRGKAVAEAGGDTADVAGNAVCTDPNPNPRPCWGCAPDGTQPVEYVGTPLVVNMGNGPWRLTGLDDAVLFDIDADGHADRIAWTARDSALAFVALDRNHNGSIDDSSELFGDHTRLPNGRSAANGFEALQAFDQNGDAVIDAADTLWRGLLLWIDANHDGTSQSGELTAIASSSIRGLSTEYHRTGRTDAYGNEFRYKSQVIRERGREPYYDIYFRVAR